MLQYSKQTDESREAGPVQCWCLHGAVGAASDWRDFTRMLATHRIGSRAVDLWRFLDCQPMTLTATARALNAEAAAAQQGGGRILLGYSLGGRIALHALLEDDPPWQAAVIVSAHPGLDDPAERETRRAADAMWATKALTGNWADFLHAWHAQPVLAAQPIRDPAAEARLAQRRREIARSFIDWSLGAQDPLWPRLATLRIPVLWVAGEQDPKFIELARRATAMIPHSRLAIAPGSGHRVPWQGRDWLADEVARFVASGA